jgi:prevent-host-death family protein
MTTMLVSDFKAKCLAVLDHVHSAGEPVLVTRRGKPLARVVPVAERSRCPRKLGALAGEAIARGDIVHVGRAEDWESLK